MTEQALQTTPEEKEKKFFDDMGGQPGAMTLQPRDYASAWKASQVLAKSTMVPKDLQGNPQNVLAVTMMGAEFGLTMMKSVRTIHVIKDQPSMSADLIVGLILSSPVCEYFTCIETDEKHAVYETKRTNNPKPSRLEFTIEQAAGYMRGRDGIKDNWRDSAPDMLRHRCSSKLARMVYPDIVTGLYTPEEIAEAVEVENEMDEQPVVQQEGESKAAAFVREKKKAEAGAAAEAIVDAEVVEPPDDDDDLADEPEPEEEEEEEESSPAREEESLALEQVDEINDILRGAYKGFGTEKQNYKRLRMYEELDEFLQKNQKLTADEPNGYRMLHIVPRRHYDLVKAWAVNIAQEIRDEEGGPA